VRLILTPRQRQICDLLTCGAQNEEIGQLLHLATRTIKYEFGQIYSVNRIRGGIRRVKLAISYYREQNRE